MCEFKLVQVFDWFLCPAGFGWLALELWGLENQKHETQIKHINVVILHLKTSCSKIILISHFHTLVA